MLAKAFPTMNLVISDGAYLLGEMVSFAGAILNLQEIMP